MAATLWRTMAGSARRWKSSLASQEVGTARGGSSSVLPILGHRFTPISSQETPSEHYHVKLDYLHPSTKDAPAVRRPGDMATGRVRPDRLYVPLSKHIFGHPPRRDLLYASVVYYLDSRRKGLASTKTRGEVAFSGAKIRSQKGSGRARLGSRANPLLRKGGVIHGPKPRDMRSKLNRRVRELALRSALSVRLAQGRLSVIKDVTWDPPPHSTRPLQHLLRARQWMGALFLTAPRHPLPAVSSSMKPNPKPSAGEPVYTEEQIADHDGKIRNLFAAVNNMGQTQIIALHRMKDHARTEDGHEMFHDRPIELQAYHILRHGHLICDLGAIEWLEEKFGGAIFHDSEIMEIARDLKEIDEEGLKMEDGVAMVDEQIMGKADEAVASLGHLRALRDPLDT